MTGNKFKTILITGINGFLGSHLAKSLSNGFNIVGLVYKKNNLHRLSGLDFKIYESKKDDFEKIFLENKIFAVIHAATVYGNKNESIDNLLNTNVILPIKLFELSNRNSTSLFLNTDSFFNQINSKYNYLSDYIRSKRHVLEWLRSMSNKCTLVNMKLFHMYGPGDAQNKFVPNILNLLKNNLPFIDLTLGEQKRDFIFIDDVVNAYNIILDEAKQLNQIHYQFEVGTGKSISIQEFVKLAKKIAKSSTVLNFGKVPYRKDEIMDAKANNNSLKKLGWKPKINLSIGIEQVLADMGINN